MTGYTIPTTFVSKAGNTMQARRAITPGMDKIAIERTQSREQARNLRRQEKKNG